MSEHERALNRLAPKYGAAPSASPVICPACRQRVKSADERIAALEARLGEMTRERVAKALEQQDMRFDDEVLPAGTYWSGLADAVLALLLPPKGAE